MRPRWVRSLAGAERRKGKEVEGGQLKRLRNAEGMSNAHANSVTVNWQQSTREAVKTLGAVTYTVG